MKYITVFAEHITGNESMQVVAGFTFPRPVTHKEFFQSIRHMLMRSDYADLNCIEIRSGGFVDMYGNTHGMSESLQVGSRESDKEIINSQHTGIFFPVDHIKE